MSWLSCGGLQGFGFLHELCIDLADDPPGQQVIWFVTVLAAIPLIWGALRLFKEIVPPGRSPTPPPPPELTIVPITNSRSALIQDVMALHRKCFDNDPRNRDQDRYFRQWIKEFEDEIKVMKTEPNWVEFWLVAVYDSRVLGYLYASYKREYRYIFINYVCARRSEFSQKREVVGALLRRLLEYALGKRDLIEKRIDLNANAIVGEFEYRKRRGKLLAGDVKKQYFLTAASSAGHPLYIIDIRDYREPLMDVDEVRSFPEDSPPMGDPHILAYAPLRDLAEETISKEEAAAILHYVLCIVYGNSYESDPEDHRVYQHYTGCLYRWFESRLPARVPLSRVV